MRRHSRWILGKLVVPLVKAVQELSDEIERLKSEKGHRVKT